MRVKLLTPGGKHAPFQWDIKNGTPVAMKEYSFCVKSCTSDKPKVVPMAEQVRHLARPLLALPRPRPEPRPEQVSFKHIVFNIKTQCCPRAASVPETRAARKPPRAASLRPASSE